MENILYSNHSLIIEGDRLFRNENLEGALVKYKEYVNLLPNLAKFVLGRIAITQLELQRFEEAKNTIKQAIEQLKQREKEYSVILAECYIGLKEYKQAFNYCNNYIEKYGRSSDIEEILGRILPNEEYSLLLRTNDLNYDQASCANAILAISRKYYMSGDFDEAEYYANKRINYSDLDAIQGYYMLGTIYNETREYYKCSNLIDRLKRSSISGREKSAAFSFLLEIYKNSLCYPLSVWGQPESKLEDLLEVYVKIKEEINIDKIKAIFNNYRPSLNLIEQFNFEVKFQLTQIN